MAVVGVVGVVDTEELLLADNLLTLLLLLDSDVIAEVVIVVGAVALRDKAPAGGEQDFVVLKLLIMLLVFATTLFRQLLNAELLRIRLDAGTALGEVVEVPLVLRAPLLIVAIAHVVPARLIVAVVG